MKVVPDLNFGDYNLPEVGDNALASITYESVLQTGLDSSDSRLSEVTSKNVLETVTKFVDAALPSCLHEIRHRLLRTMLFFFSFFIFKEGVGWVEHNVGTLLALLLSC